MTEQNDTPEAPRPPFAAFGEKIAEMFPGLSMHAAPAADDEGDDEERARAIRAFALEQSIIIQAAAGASLHSPAVLDNAIVFRAARFAKYVETGVTLSDS